MAKGQALLEARFGMGLPGVEVPDVIAPLLDRRVVRRYTDQAVPDSLLDALLAAAQSAPAKSDLQQYSVVVMRDPRRIKQIADWIGTMDWIATAPVFLVWCVTIAARPEVVRNARHAAREQQPRHVSEHRRRLRAGDGAIHGGGRGGRPRHLPDFVCSQPYRAGFATARPSVRRLSGGWAHGRMAGVPPPGVDASAALGRRASGALRRQHDATRRRRLLELAPPRT